MSEKIEQFIAKAGIERRILENLSTNIDIAKPLRLAQEILPSHLVVELANNVLDYLQRSDQAAATDRFNAALSGIKQSVK